jgi:2-polyprenyl-6-methoxyphenol hydroxylase-like FAD-dependent oxidoreductase
MNAAHADHYYSGRAVLVGDAAHTFTPTSGMGLNLALRDGTEAALILADIIDHDRPDTALEEYEQLCRPIAGALLDPELNSDPKVHP